MSDLGIDTLSGASGNGAFTNLAGASDVPDAWTTAMANASRSAPASDKADPPKQEGGGSWLDRGLGILQAGVGVLEVGVGVVGGVLTSETGVGAVAGGLVALHGVDDIQAGVRQAWTGKPTETVTQQAVTGAAQHAGAPPAVAAAIGIGVDIAAGGGFGGAEKAAVKGAEGALTVARDLAEADKGIDAARGTERAAELARAAEPSKADLDAYRASLGVRGDIDTIAVGRTNVPGLENEVLKGASPKVRKEAGLPDLNKAAPDRPIKSPNPNPQASRHAEEELANDFVAKVEAAHLNPADLDGKTLNIHISYSKGVCSTCMQGLAEGSKAPAGVIKQLSERYPGLTIRITAEGGNAYAGRTVVEILNGRIIN